MKGLPAVDSNRLWSIEQNDLISEPEKMDILRHAMKGLPAVDSNRLWSIMIKELSNAYNNMPGGDEWSALKPLMSKFKINWDRFESLAQKHGYNSVSDLFNNIEKERSNSLDEAKQYDPDYDEGMRLVQDYYDGELDFDEFFDAAVDMTRINGKINPAGVDNILRRLHDSEKSSEPITYDMVMRHAQQDRAQNNNHGDDDHQAYNNDTDYPSKDISKAQFESKGKSLSQAAKTVKKGALHKQEGIPKDKKIGDKKLNSLKKSGTPLEKKRANFALNIQGKGKKKVDENMDMEECTECMMGECSVHGLNELSRGSVVRYQIKAQPELRKLKQQPVDDFVSNMRQGHRIGDAANMAVQNNVKAIKKAKTRSAGLDRAKSRLDGEYASEGATPDQLDQQKISQMKRAAATRKNSRALQQQPAQSGPRRSEVPAFIRKGRGDPALDHNDLEETNMYSESDKDILDYLKAKLVPNRGNARAKSRPYNGSAGDADAYNGMEFEEADSKFDKREISPGRTQYTRKYDPDTGLNIGTDSGDSAPAASDGPRKRGRQPGTKFSGGYAARHDGSHVSKAKMNSRKKDMDEEDEYSRHTVSKSPAGGTVYTRKYDPDTGLSIGTDSGDSAPAASDGPRKRGRQPGTKFSGGYAARHDGSHVSKAKMNSRKKDMDEGSATCPHCGHAMADEGREVDMEGVKNGMGSFVKAAKKVAGISSAVKKAKKDYDGDGKKETSKAEHAGVVDKAIKANKAKPAKQTKEGAKPDFIDVDKDGDKKEPMKKAAKEKKVDETTSGSVSTAPAKKSSGGSGVGKGIYDSWERKYESLLKEDVNVTTNSSKNDEGEEEEHITIDVSGDDVARIKEMLHNMGVSHGGDEAGHAHGGEEPCDSCGGVPCQCDEMDEGINDHGDDSDYTDYSMRQGEMGLLGNDTPEGHRNWHNSQRGGDLDSDDYDSYDDGGEDTYMRDPLFMPHPHDLITDPFHPYFKKDMDEETSFKDAGSTVGRIGGTIAGGLGGFAAGGPVGAVAGGIAGGSAGSALGTAAGRWLDKKTGAPEETDEDMSGHQRMMELAGLGEANVTVSDNEPDYPSNQEYSNDEMQYSGGLNGKKSTGQATVPVVGNQVNRLHSHVSEGQRMNDLYKAIAAIEDKEV